MKYFVTVANFTYSSEYVVLKMLLNQEEIDYFFKNEASFSILPITFCGRGGIELQVHKKDVEKTLKIIEDFNSNASLEIV